MGLIRDRLVWIENGHRRTAIGPLEDYNVDTRGL
jgi:hypothetical protein